MRFLFGFEQDHYTEHPSGQGHVPVVTDFWSTVVIEDVNVKLVQFLLIFFRAGFLMLFHMWGTYLVKLLED